VNRADLEQLVEALCQVVDDLTERVTQLEMTMYEADPFGPRPMENVMVSNEYL
jgi:hypothetical protein